MTPHPVPATSAAAAATASAAGPASPVRDNADDPAQHSADLEVDITDHADPLPRSPVARFAAFAAQPFAAGLGAFGLGGSRAPRFDGEDSDKEKDMLDDDDDLDEDEDEDDDDDDVDDDVRPYADGENEDYRRHADGGEHSDDRKGHLFKEDDDDEGIRDIPDELFRGRSSFHRGDGSREIHYSDDLFRELDAGHFPGQDPVLHRGPVDDEAQVFDVPDDSEEDVNEDGVHIGSENDVLIDRNTDRGVSDDHSRDNVGVAEMPQGRHPALHPDHQEQTAGCATRGHAHHNACRMDDDFDSGLSDVGQQSQQDGGHTKHAHAPPHAHTPSHPALQTSENLELADETFMHEPRTYSDDSGYQVDNGQSLDYRKVDAEEDDDDGYHSASDHLSPNETPVLGSGDVDSRETSETFTARTTVISHEPLPTSDGDTSKSPRPHVSPPHLVSVPSIVGQHVEAKEAYIGPYDACGETVHVNRLAHKATDNGQAGHKTIREADVFDDDEPSEEHLESEMRLTEADRGGADSETTATLSALSQLNVEAIPAVPEYRIQRSESEVAVRLDSNPSAVSDGHRIENHDGRFGEHNMPDIAVVGSGIVVPPPAPSGDSALELDDNVYIAGGIADVSTAGQHLNYQPEVGLGNGLHDGMKAEKDEILDGRTPDVAGLPRAHERDDTHGSGFEIHNPNFVEGKSALANSTYPATSGARQVSPQIDDNQSQPSVPREYRPQDDAILRWNAPHSLSSESTAGSGHAITSHESANIDNPITRREFGNDVVERTIDESVVTSRAKESHVSESNSPEHRSSRADEGREDCSECANTLHNIAESVPDEHGSESSALYQSVALGAPAMIGAAALGAGASHRHSVSRNGKDEESSGLTTVSKESDRDQSDERQPRKGLAHGPGECLTQTQAENKAVFPENSSVEKSTTEWDTGVPSVTLVSPESNSDQLMAEHISPISPLSQKSGTDSSSTCTHNPMHVKSTPESSPHMHDNDPVADVKSLFGTPSIIGADVLPATGTDATHFSSDEHRSGSNPNQAPLIAFPSPIQADNIASESRQLDGSITGVRPTSATTSNESNSKELVLGTVNQREISLKPDIPDPHVEVSSRNETSRSEAMYFPAANSVQVLTPETQVRNDEIVDRGTIASDEQYSIHSNEPRMSASTAHQSSDSEVDKLPGTQALLHGLPNHESFGCNDRNVMDEDVCPQFQQDDDWKPYLETAPHGLRPTYLPPHYSADRQGHGSQGSPSNLDIRQGGRHTMSTGKVDMTDEECTPQAIHDGTGLDRKQSAQVTSPNLDNHYAGQDKGESYGSRDFMSREDVVVHRQADNEPLFVRVTSDPASGTQDTNSTDRLDDILDVDPHLTDGIKFGGKNGSDITLQEAYLEGEVIGEKNVTVHDQAFVVSGSESKLHSNSIRNEFTAKIESTGRFARPDELSEMRRDALVYQSSGMSLVPEKLYQDPGDGTTDLLDDEEKIEFLENNEQSRGYTESHSPVCNYADPDSLDMRGSEVDAGQLDEHIQHQLNDIVVDRLGTQEAEKLDSHGESADFSQLKPDSSSHNSGVKPASCGKSQVDRAYDVSQPNPAIAAYIDGNRATEVSSLKRRLHQYADCLQALSVKANQQLKYAIRDRNDAISAGNELRVENESLVKENSKLKVKMRTLETENESQKSRVNVTHAAMNQMVHELDFHRQSADKQRRTASENANKAATAMQLKTSYAAQVTAMRKERDAAQKDRDSALTELADMKARLAAASCEIDMLKDSKRSMEDEVRSVRSELTARSLSEADRHAVNEREKLFAAMLGDFSHVASQYLPSLLAHPLSKNPEEETDRSTKSELDSSTEKVGALL